MLENETLLNHDSIITPELGDARLHPADADCHAPEETIPAIVSNTGATPTSELEKAIQAALQTAVMIEWGGAEQFRLIYPDSFDDAGIMIGVFDAECRLLYANDGVERWYKVDKNALLGRHLGELTAYEFPQVEADIQQVFRSNRGIINERHSMLPTPHSWYKVSMQPVRSSSGETIAVLVMAHDITEAKRRSRDEMQMQLELEHMASVISMRFVNLSFEQAETAISHTLAEIGASTKASCVHLFVTNADYTEVTASHQWCAAGVDEETKRSLAVALPNLRWSVDVLKRDMILDIAHIDDLPDAAHSDRLVYAQLNLQSLLAVALSGYPSIRIVLSLSMVSRRHKWSRFDRLLLKLVGDTLSRAFTRWQDEVQFRELHHSLEQRFAERKAEALRLARAMEATSEGMAIIQRETFVYVNRAFARLHGYSVHELIGQPWKPLYAFSDDAALIQSVTAVLRTEGAWTGVTKARTRHGDIFDSELTLTVTEDELILSERDVTARVEAERALLRAEKRYHSLFENAPVMYATLGEDSLGIPVITDCNQQFLTILGYSRDEIVGQWLGYIHTPESRKQLCERFMNKEERLLLAEECELVTSSGRRLHALLQTRRDTDAQGNFIQALAMYVDITALKQAEAQLRDLGDQYRNLAQRLVAAREDERTKIAREIHDDLGQMLTVLKLDIDWLAKKLPTETPPLAKRLAAMRDLIGDVIKSVQRLSSELRPNLLDTLGLVPAVAWQLQQFKERTELTTTFTTNAPEALALPPDLSTALFRVFQEALTNVARHAQAHRVDVGLNLRDNQLWLVVRDDGCGFDPSVLNSTNSLGLIGMRERLAPWQGTLELASAPGHGAEVHAKVPIPALI